MHSSCFFAQPYHLLEHFFTESRNPTSSAFQQTGYWMGHKTFTVILLPLNLIGIVAGLGGMVLSACTLGAFKIMVFAISLGNLKPEFETGFLHAAFLTIDIM